MNQTRIDKKFAALKRENKKALITYIMAGDPNYDTSLAILKALPKAGADIIELGIAFSDPMADGPTIQDAALRALKAGQTLKKTLQMVAELRQEDQETPLLLMGYYNPIYVYGVEKFLIDAKNAGVDGLLIVDLPREMDRELCIPAIENSINFIRLITPTTDKARLANVVENTSGFLYYVSMTGTTGKKIANIDTIEGAIKRIREDSPLPIAIGFGIKTKEHARAVAQMADGIVVGSAIIDAITSAIESDQDQNKAIDAACELVRTLNEEVKAVS